MHRRIAPLAASIVLVATGIGACACESRAPSIGSEPAIVAQPGDATLASDVVECAEPQKSEPAGVPSDETPRMLEIHAIDVFSTPIPNAVVLLNSSGSILATAGSDGIALVGPFRTATVDLVVSAENFEPTPVRGYRLSRDLEQLEVMLSRTYSVRVRVVDSDGSVVVPDQLNAIASEANVVGIVSRCPDEPCFLVDDLPPEPFRLVARIMGVVLLRGHDPRNPVAVIEVPQRGSVLIEFSEPIANPGQCYVLLEATAPVRTGMAPDQYFINRTLSGEPPIASLEVPIVFVGRYAVDVYETIPTAGSSRHRGRVENVLVRAGERTVVRVPITR